MRKKAVQNLDSRQLTLIENAFFYCNPPERQKVIFLVYFEGVIRSLLSEIFGGFVPALDLQGPARTVASATEEIC